MIVLTITSIYLILGILYWAFNVITGVDGTVKDYMIWVLTWPRIFIEKDNHENKS